MLEIMGAMAFNSQQKDLSISGLCQTNLVAEHVVIAIDEIANNREWQNLSGTLAIELWALAKPYLGQDFHGEPLAATAIGALLGQHCLRRCKYELNYTAPTKPYAEICLMLREWQGSEGYVTRDFVTLSGDADTPEVDEFLSPLLEDLPDEELESNSSEQESDVFDEHERKSKRKVSINNAEFSELHSVKGIDKKLARVIIAGRPYRKKKALLQLPSFNNKKFKKLKRKLRK